MSEFPRTIIVKDVTAKWCKISGDDAPVNTFKSKQWEMQIQTTDPKKVEELKGYGLKVKEGIGEDKGVFSVNLKRKGLKSDGNGGQVPNTPVKIVDTKVQPITGDNIGNGSKVNVNLWQYPYEAPGVGKGIATSLTAVQVVELVEYTPSAGFEVIATEAAKDGSLPF